MPKTDREIVVSYHAVDAYRRRLMDNRPFDLIHDEIVSCIKDGFAAGRVFNHKPQGFVLYRRRSAALPEGQRFVQCSENHGFIVKPSGDSEIVVTMLTRVGVRR